MLSPLAASSATATTNMPATMSPAARRTQMMARGPGWLLGEGESGEWHVRVTGGGSNVAATFTHLHRSLRELIADHGGRPLRLDLEHSPRLRGTATLTALSLLLADLDRMSVRVAVHIGADLIQCARVQRVIDLHAPVQARCVMTRAEADEWLLGERRAMGDRSNWLRSSC